MSSRRRTALPVLLLLGLAAHPVRAWQIDRATLAAKVDSIARASMAAERIPGLSIAASARC